jgi:NAD(P)H dehydrogenase (quinone)
MKVLVLYFSKGGNTAKLAKQIARGVEAGSAEAVIKTTGEVTKDDFLEAAGVIA